MGGVGDGVCEFFYYESKKKIFLGGGGRLREFSLQRIRI